MLYHKNQNESLQKDNIQNIVVSSRRKPLTHVAAVMLGSCGVLGVTLTATTSNVMRGASMLIR